MRERRRIRRRGGRRGGIKRTKGTTEKNIKLRGSLLTWKPYFILQSLRRQCQPLLADQASQFPDSKVQNL